MVLLSASFTLPFVLYEHTLVIGRSEFKSLKSAPAKTRLVALPLLKFFNILVMDVSTVVIL